MKHNIKIEEEKLYIPAKIKSDASAKLLYKIFIIL